MADAIVVGASGHAKVIMDAMRTRGEWAPIGLLDDRVPMGTVVHGERVLGGVSDIDQVLSTQRVQAVVVAIGDNFVRHAVVERIAHGRPYLQFPVVLHPQAIVSESAQIGPGSVILAGAVVGVDARIGRFCILNTNSSLDHDAAMEDFASAAPGAALAGGSFVGEFTAVGVGAVLNHGIHVGAHSVVGSGAVVVSSIPAEVVAYGVPARVIRSRRRGEKYL